MHGSESISNWKVLEEQTKATETIHKYIYIHILTMVHVGSRLRHQTPVQCDFLW